ncbi:MAG TPA: hypothetical protein VK819_10295 [Acidobacteriaceae bacterium]|nr:hypothetical protein [Acidobacteriaceae bacterium]
MSFARLIVLLSLFASTVFAQQLTLPSDSSSSMSAVQTLAAPAGEGGGGSGRTAAAAEMHSTPFSGFAIGAKVGLLGIGVQAATPLSHRLNLSGGVNFFSYTDNLTSDGIPYNATLRFRSGEASLDWFPFVHSFHISPGALLYNGNQITASAAVPGGTTFTLNNVTYMSSTTDPVTGNGSLKFNKAAPKVTVGFGNMIPRNGHHFSMPVELGVAYVGDPKVVLDLNGTACDPNGAYCQSIASTPQIEANVLGQQMKIANDAKPARFYPILSLGLAYSF